MIDTPMAARRQLAPEGKVMNPGFTAIDAENGLAEAEAGDDGRHDFNRRDIINQAIAVQMNANTVSAVEYLKAHEIDAGIIERVLLEPQRRRRAPHH
jgi:hypothetical protein